MPVGPVECPTTTVLLGDRHGSTVVFVRVYDMSNVPKFTIITSI